jgi:hypothetical protein
VRYSKEESGAQGGNHFLIGLDWVGVGRSGKLRRGGLAGGEREELPASAATMGSRMLRASVGSPPKLPALGPVVLCIERVHPNVTYYIHVSVTFWVETIFD